MIGLYYILDGHEPKQTNDMEVWHRLMFGEESDKRTVAFDQIGDVMVSTVFLGLNHALGDEDRILFETMVFGGPLDRECVRYATWDEAEHGHAVMVDRVKARV
jgi:hypothetical protein